MKPPTPDQFPAFFHALYGYEPFPWQRRLAQRVCAGDWPSAIALPTAAGKTACIDAAVFALACGAPDAPRRIFFVVDRRLVVDQAKLHADNLAEKLTKAAANDEDPVLHQVAQALRRLADPGDPGTARPLDTYALRGGIYRESAWARSPLQPAVVASTVDQVGSRMLFRGYGVSDSMKPVHAALVANDAIILLDEAHCARPFEQTVRAVERYRSWHEPTTPLRFVSITATPSDAVDESQIERANDEDRAHKVLGRRINAAKPARLVVAKGAKGKDGTKKLVQELKEQALDLAVEGGCVGIIVNRVKTARMLHLALSEKEPDTAVLLTGRMRPIDRDDIYAQRLLPLLSHADPALGPPPAFVVGTQALEVGADFDFHALVTECASLDALRQRFGRLNRVAKRKADSATPIAAVVVREDQTDPQDDEKKQDPIYGNALAVTWQWLNTKAQDGLFDFGIAAVERHCDGEILAELNVKGVDAPALFPAYLDNWVQTHPVPSPDPDPALFLHGPDHAGQPDVQVVLRNDLGDNPDLWAEIVSLCPPSSAESLRVPIGVFKRWVAGEPIEDDTINDDTGDIEGRDGSEIEDDPKPMTLRSALHWQGPRDSKPIGVPTDVRPSGVYVVPCSKEARALGDFPSAPKEQPDAPPADHAERAYRAARDKPLIRLPDVNLNQGTESFDDDLTEAIRAKFGRAAGGTVNHYALEMLCDPKRRISEPYPLASDERAGDETIGSGWVVTGTKRLHAADPTYLPDSEPAESYRGRKVALADHARGVASYARRFALGCGLDADLYERAGLWHDLGKLDPRFQAMLQGRSPRTIAPVPLAKSARPPGSAAEREAARLIHRYPKGSRHELLSVALAAQHTDDDLLLHLLATHHGSARPFVNPIHDVDDSINTAIDREFLGTTFTADTCTQDLPARNAELAHRFWRIVRKHGWWGAAYHEAILRLADHAQSRDEQERDWESKDSASETVPIPMFCESVTEGFDLLPLPGLDGSNPLAYLTAIGTLAVCEQWARSKDRPDWLGSSPRLCWGDGHNPHTPVLRLQGPVPDPEVFCERLADHLVCQPDAHSAAAVIDILGDKSADTATAVRDAFQTTGPAGRVALDWSSALICDAVPDAASQLQTVRKDYLIGNLRSIIQRNTAEHLVRSLFHAWDYADALNNQSLHWEPTEDRRHAYQWYMPSGDPTRSKRGGMLGANRLALEAWPLFPSFPAGDRVATRGFKGRRVTETYWTWPLWQQPLGSDAIASLIALPQLQAETHHAPNLNQLGIRSVFRLQRILVGKTPNLTTAKAMV